MKLFIAQTIDGFIAGEGGSLDHLNAFQGNEYGYDEYIKSVNAVVLGRASFDKIYPTHGWTYPPHVRGIVMTSRPLPDDVPSNVITATDAEAVAGEYPEAFLDGGGQTIRSFMERGFISEARIFTLPITLGRGVRLFLEGQAKISSWTLQNVKSFPCGTICSHYIRG
jgi:dihydrofolate reductase